MRFESVLYKGDPEDEDARWEWAVKHQRQYTKQELLFDWDPHHGILETYDYDPATGVMAWKREGDASSLLSDNAEWRGAEQNWRKKEDKWLRYASIPMGVVEMWMQEGINVYHAETDRNGVPNEHLKAVLKKLRDPEWRWLKTVDLDMGDGNQEGMTRLGCPVPGNGFPWLVRDTI